MNEWWRGAVIYQIYPRSFLDTDKDGVGNIAGITRQLDYVARLGVDMIWISPFYPSPMKDFGYDVSNYKDIEPVFGNLDDFAAMVEKADALNIKVMIDLVLSHTSDQHPWFVESRASRENAKSDWYIWADAKPDGTPPNNWLSIFGGNAWEWDTSRRQYYMHNFLTAQPDLNFHNPDVVEAALDVTEFWLKLGVHGFRLDTVNWYFHDKQLRDNPPSQGEKLLYVPESSNYGMQEHIYNKSRPEVLTFLEQFRALLDQYGAIGLGELTAKAANEMTPEYTAKDRRLHMVYTFALLTEGCSASHFKQVIRTIESHVGDGWVCWAFSNHDVVRTVSRWRRENVSMVQQAKFFLALLLSLRGSLCIYQGEELGLPEAELAFEELQDPYGIRLWPEYKGRDGCRTPMPWDDALPNGGFSTTKPWLPVPGAHVEKAVTVQQSDEDSVLQFTRKFLAWRKSQPAMLHGSLRVLESDDSLLVLERRYENAAILAVFNVKESICDFDGSQYGYSKSQAKLPGYGMFFAEL
ncbi:MAG: alpha-amylase family glycosyl hydrolase [Cyanobacteria bacterium J06581_3]